MGAPSRAAFLFPAASVCASTDRSSLRHAPRPCAPASGSSNRAAASDDPCDRGGTGP
jgi:hypothetical protein